MEQTFVLKLVQEFNLETGTVQGHVEDVKTGKALRFHSVSELLRFLEKMTKQKTKQESLED